jgi:hypothetical protein
MRRAEIRKQERASGIGPSPAPEARPLPDRERLGRTVPEFAVGCQRLRTNRRHRCRAGAAPERGLRLRRLVLGRGRDRYARHAHTFSALHILPPAVWHPGGSPIRDSLAVCPKICPHLWVPSPWRSHGHPDLNVWQGSRLLCASVLGQRCAQRDESHDCYGTSDFHIRPCLRPNAV